MEGAYRTRGVENSWHTAQMFGLNCEKCDEEQYYTLHDNWPIFITEVELQMGTNDQSALNFNVNEIGRRGQS